MAFESLKPHLKNVFFQRLSLVGISGIVLMLSGIILIPIMTKTLTAREYGQWVQLIAILGVLFVVSELGIALAMSRFIMTETNVKKVSEQFHTTLFSVMALNIIVSLFLLISPQLTANYIFGGEPQLVYSIPFILPIIGINTVCLYFFRARNQIKKFTLFTNLQAYLVAAIVGVMVISQKSLMAAVAGYTVAQIILFWIMFALIVREIGISAPNISYLKDYLKFGLPITSSGIVQEVIGHGDRVLIGIFMTMGYVGYYSTAFSVGFGLMFMAAPFTTVLPQTLASLYDKGKVSESKDQIKQSLTMFLCAAIPVGIVVSIFRSQFLELISTHEIAQNSAPLIPVLVIAALLYGCQSLLSCYLFITKETGAIFVISVITASVAVLLNITLIPIVGIMGAAIAILAAFSVQTSILAYKIWWSKS